MQIGHGVGLTRRDGLAWTWATMAVLACALAVAPAAAAHTGQGSALPSNDTGFSGHPWGTDGCSNPAPDKGWFYNFGHACIHHDGCYKGFPQSKSKTAAATYWASRQQCDNWFLADMQASCRWQHQTPAKKKRDWKRTLNRCNNRAQIYYGAVQGFAQNAYKRPPGTPLGPVTTPSTPPPAPAPAPAPAPTSAPMHIYHVHNTCADRSCGLWVMTAPGSSFGGRQIGTLSDGTAVNIRCQTVGGMISGGEGMNDVWDQIDYAGGIGYVADLYMNTPGGDTPQPHRHFSPGIPRC